MLSQQLFIIWPHTLLNNMFETAGLIQDSLQSQAEYILNNVHQCSDANKIFFSNLFRAQKDLSKNLQTAVNSNFHNLNRLLFDQEIPTIAEPLNDTPRAGKSGSGTSGTSKSETTDAGNKKTSSDSRYGKTKKSKTATKSKEKT